MNMKVSQKVEGGRWMVEGGRWNGRWKVEVSYDPQALSKEYTAIIPHKTRALADAHTYATRPFASNT